jgi:threonine dehydrogenase-like Zn-dependent dehydrogenase
MMKALRLKATGKLAIHDVEKPVPGPNDVLVKVDACGICGTDRHLFHGEFPSTPPVILGHEFTGVVEAVGSGVKNFQVGMRVTGDPNISCGLCPECQRGRVNLCRNLRAIGIQRDGGFADYVCMPETQAFALPAGLDPLHGAFCEPLACCIHGVDMAEIKTGDSVVVLGGGVIGLLVVQLARLAGATRVVLATRNAEKRSLAESIGATATVDPSSGDVLELIAGDDGILPAGADVVLECAGVPETVEQTPRLARKGGTAVILGVMPQGAKVSIEPFDLIASGAIKVEPLISRRIGFEEALETIANPAPSGEIRALVIPGL